MLSLYKTDVYTWAMTQAEAAKRRSHNGLNGDHVAEELRLSGAAEKRELGSRYRVLLTHLLKWIYQPEQRGWSWDNTIRNQRLEPADHLAMNLGLRSEEPEPFAKAYALARAEASSETDLPLETFPEDPPFTMAWAKDETWWPQ